MFWWVVSQDEKRRQPDGPEAIVRLAASQSNQGGEKGHH